MPGFPAYESASECFLDVVRREGGRGLYRGIAPSLAKVLPASSISYAVYDTLSAERR
jgi:solute carrier family 25 phosphate transporter 23/24/25/41